MISRRTCSTSSLATARSAGHERGRERRAAGQRARRAVQHVRGAARCVRARRRTQRDAVAERPRLLGERREEQVVLRREVAVQRAERDRGARRDVAHLHGVVPADDRQVDRRLDHPRPSLRGLLVAIGAGVGRGHGGAH
jgi:hypothetical protein